MFVDFKSSFNKAILVFVFISGTNGGRVPPPVNTELLLSREEKVALEKVKSSISFNASEKWEEDLAKNDIFYLRWIRAKNKNAEKAIEGIREFWRFVENQKIGKILQENWSDMNELYPYWTDAVDREGRPVGYVNLGEWNIRRGILQGKQSRITRYMYKIAFEITIKLLEINQKMSNVSQIVMIVNLDGFNPFEHACARCIQTYFQLTEMYENFMPGFSHEIIVINAPPAWHIVYRLARPIMRPETRKTVKIFDTNRSNWKHYLDMRIDPGQLPWEFGGRKNRN